jgi:hypothetical protein
MWRTGRDTLAESTIVLVLMGMLAGAIGGLGVGLIAQKSSSSSSSSSSSTAR